MTWHEAKEIIKNVQERIEKENTALSMAVKAADRMSDKQIMLTRDYAPYCPSCGSFGFLLNKNGSRMNYCGNCGQKIEWRIEDE